MHDKIFYVYILASKKNGTLYVGMTSNIRQRLYQHKEKAVDGFTKKYGVDRLVWYEKQLDAESAILREKQLKKWNRSWKLRLINENNAEWNDLYDVVIQ